MRDQIWLAAVVAGALGWAAAEHAADAKGVNRALPAGLVIASLFAAMAGPGLWSLCRIARTLLGIGGESKGRWRVFVRLGAAIFLAAVGSGLAGLVMPPGPGTLGILGAIVGATILCGVLVLACWLDVVCDDKPGAFGAGEVAAGFSRGLAAACYWLTLALWAWGLYSYVLPGVANWHVAAQPGHDGGGYKGPLVAAVFAVAAGLCGVWPWIVARRAMAHLGRVGQSGTRGHRCDNIAIIGYAVSAACGTISITLYCTGAAPTVQHWFLGLALLPAYAAAGCAGVGNLVQHSA